MCLSSYCLVANRLVWLKQRLSISCAGLHSIFLRNFGEKGWIASLVYSSTMTVLFKPGAQHCDLQAISFEYS